MDESHMHPVPPRKRCTPPRKRFSSVGDFLAAVEEWSTSPAKNNYPAPPAVVRVSGREMSKDVPDAEVASATCATFACADHLQSTTEMDATGKEHSRETLSTLRRSKRLRQQHFANETFEKNVLQQSVCIDN